MFRKLSPLWMACLLLLSACDDPTDDQTYDYLFTMENTYAQTQPTGSKTFVIWVNGDADHFVPVESSVPGELKRADSVEVERIRQFAQSCYDCNIVLLHEQRGGAHWYTTDTPWATYLHVFINGVNVLERHVSQLNGANPKMLGRLVHFADQLFPSTETHLIYRGHSILPTYDPKTAAQDGIAPFIYSHPELPYGIHEFAQGLALSERKEPLASVVFAACSMSFMDAALAIAPYAKVMIAPQVDILETLSVSFGFAWLYDPYLGKGPEDVAHKIAAGLMQPFRETKSKTEAMMEYPVTLIDLTKAADLKFTTERLLDDLQSWDPSFLNTHEAELLSQSPVEKVLSQRYVDYLKAQGKKDTEIQAMIRFVRSPAAFKEVDWIGFLNGLVLGNYSPWLSYEAAEARDLWQSAVKVYDQPAHSIKWGVSWRLPVSASSK